jgi:hypothetical protein
LGNSPSIFVGILPAICAGIYSGISAGLPARNRRGVRGFPGIP